MTRIDQLDGATRLKVFLLMLGCWICATTRTASAQAPPELQKLYASANGPPCQALMLPRILQSHRARLLDAMDPLSKAKLGNTPVKCVSYGYGEAMAVRTSQGEVLIHTHYAASLRRMIEASLIEKRFPDPARRNLAERYHYRVLETLEFSNRPFVNLLDFAQLSTREKAIWSNDSKSLNELQSLFEMSLLYVMAHELGHEFYGHIASSPANEQEADDWATQVLLDANIPAGLAAAAAMLHVRLLEMPPWYRTTPPTHPEPTERALRVLRLSSVRSKLMFKTVFKAKVPPGAFEQQEAAAKRALEELQVLVKESTDEQQLLKSASGQSNGAVVSAYRLGEMYLRGAAGVKQNKVLARKYLEKAVALPRAQFTLAWMYEMGVGGPRQSCLALILYSRAARVGFSRAMQALQMRGLDPANPVHTQAGFVEQCPRN